MTGSSGAGARGESTLTALIRALPTLLWLLGVGLAVGVLIALA